MFNTPFFYDRNNKILAVSTASISFETSFYLPKFMEEIIQTLPYMLSTVRPTDLYIFHLLYERYYCALQALTFTNDDNIHLKQVITQDIADLAGDYERPLSIDFRYFIEATKSIQYNRTYIVLLQKSEDIIREHPQDFETRIRTYALQDWKNPFRYFYETKNDYLKFYFFMLVIFCIAWGIIVFFFDSPIKRGVLGFYTLGYIFMAIMEYKENKPYW